MPVILQFPNVALRRVVLPVSDATFATSGLREYCQKLANLLVAAERCDVLAGTQIDEDPAWAVLALSAGNAIASGVSILCNPVIRDESGNSVDFDRSASFACTPALLSAPTKLTVDYRTPRGERRQVVCGRSGARAVFQGVESLRGRLLLDRMTMVEAHSFVRRYREELEERIAPRLFLPDSGIVVPN